MFSVYTLPGEITSGESNVFALVILPKIEYNITTNENYSARFSAGIPPASPGKGRDPMKLQTEKGEILISRDVFTNITGAAATNCYGVKGMAVRSKTDGLVHLLRRESMSKGVKVTYHEDSSVSIELHIIVDNGVNLMAISRSIMNRVKYDVSRFTGAEVRSVDVCVDSMVIG